jgi:hypothetical protein
MRRQFTDLFIVAGKVREQRNVKVLLDLFRPAKSGIQLLLQQHNAGAGEASENPSQKQNHCGWVCWAEGNGGRLGDGNIEDSIFVEGVGNMRLFALIQIKKIVVFSGFGVAKERCLLNLLLIAIHQRLAIRLVDVFQGAGPGTQGR